MNKGRLILMIGKMHNIDLKHLLLPILPPHRLSAPLLTPHFRPPGHGHIIQALPFPHNNHINNLLNLSLA